MADAKTPAASNSVKAVANTVVADAKAAETTAVTWFSWAMTYVPASWKKYIAIVMAILALFYFGGNAIDFVWSHIPSKSSVAPTTMSAVKPSQQVPDFTAINGRLDAMFEKTAQTMATSKMLGDEVSSMERRLEALEMRRSVKTNKKPASTE